MNLSIFPVLEKVKSFFVLKIFKFLSWPFLFCRKTVCSKFMTSSTKNWLTAIYIFCNFLRSKDNQTMKLDQLMKKIEKCFLWNILRKMWWKNYFQTFFPKIKIKHISGLKFGIFYNLILLHVQVNWSLGPQLLKLEFFRKNIPTSSLKSSCRQNTSS